MQSKRRRSLGQISGGLALLDSITNDKLHLAKFILAATTDIQAYPQQQQLMLLGRPTTEQLTSLLTSMNRHSKYKSSSSKVVSPGEGGAFPSHSKAKTGKDALYAGTNDDKKISSIVDTRDLQGKTPLIRAVCLKDEKSRKKAVELLLKFGANVNAQDTYGRTALSYACQLGHNDIIKVLLRYNIDPDLCDFNGNTPLMHAISAGNTVGVDLLLRCFKRLGVMDLAHRNRQGHTALDIANKCSRECQKIIENYINRSMIMLPNSDIEKSAALLLEDDKPSESSSNENISLSELMLLKGAETQDTINPESSDLKAMLLLKRSLSLPTYLANNKTDNRLTDSLHNLNIVPVVNLKEANGNHQHTLPIIDNNNKNTANTAKRPGKKPLKKFYSMFMNLNPKPTNADANTSTNNPSITNFSTKRFIHKLFNKP